MARPAESGRAVIGVGLALMSLSSGCVDILSYRLLGEVFTSAMTGNLALLGFALGRGDAAAMLRNGTAFAGFVAGLAAGATIVGSGADRRRLVAALALEAALLALFAARCAGLEVGLGVHVLIALAAFAMGTQSAVGHRLGMSGVSTTYFTGTLTGIVFGVVGCGAERERPVGWPSLALASYVAGAAVAGWSTAGAAASGPPLTLAALPSLAAVALAATLALAGKPGVRA